MSDMKHEVVIVSHGNEEIIVFDSEEDARLIVNLLRGQIDIIKAALVQARASLPSDAR